MTWVALGEGVSRNADDTVRVQRHATEFRVDGFPFVWYTRHECVGRVWRVTGRAAAKSHGEQHTEERG